MKPQHELFAHYYILTGDKDMAYRTAYPKASGDAAKVTARRLLHQPDVREYISNHLAKVQRQTIEECVEAERRRIEEESASILLKRKVLRDIISGKRKQVRHVRVKDYIEVIEEDLPVTVILRAIDLDTKIASDWYNRKKEPPLQQPPQQQQQEDAPAAPLLPFSGTNWLELLDLQYGPDYVAHINALRVRDNPRFAEEFKRKGIRYLDRILTKEEIQQMQADRTAHWEEIRELKKFAEQYLDDETDLDQLPDDDQQDPDSIPSLYPQPAPPTPAAAESLPQTEQNETFRNFSEQNSIPGDSHGMGTPLDNGDEAG